MRIEKIILKNFSAIKLVMKCNEISIDFTEGKNKICLLVGRNGSGKTTLLSLLHPFAGLGNLDVRDGNDLILKDKEGYKEIHIRNDNDYYIIKHYYYPHKDKSHSVKSYICKNDDELNINGNVTSFKEYVKEELGIEPDYLKLVRIGSNVTSMIDLSETDRKTFMSKLLDDIGIFLSYYKKVNSDLLQLKEMISHDIDKLNKLNIESRKDVKKEIMHLEDLVNYEQKKYGDISGQISVLKHEIESIDDPYSLRDRLSISSKKLNKMNQILEKKNDLESTDPEFYRDMIKRLEEDVLKRESEIKSTEILIESTLELLNSLHDNYRSFSIQYNKEKESDKELSNIKDEYKKIKKEIKERKENIKDFEYTVTKDELDSFIIFLKNTQQILDRTYEFGKEPIKKVVTLLRNDKNVMNYINSHLMDLTDNEDEHSVFLKTLIQRFDFSQDIDSVCPDKECKARNLWIQVANLINNKEHDKEKNDLSFYRDMEYIYKNLISIIPEFGAYKKTIENLPENIKNDFLMENIFKSIEKGQRIYNEELLNDFLSLTTEYSDILRLEDKLQELDSDIKKFSSLSNLSYLIQQIDSLDSQIREKEEYIKEEKKKISKLNELNKSDNNTLEIYYELLETFEEHDNLVLSVQKLSEEYTLYKENSQKIKDLNISLEGTQKNINDLNKQIQEKNVKLSQYIELKKELKSYNQKYDEMTLIKEALSSKKGMALYFIKSYLGNTEEITNELLDIAYDGQIYIDSFHITPKEFTIPFYNRGKWIKDVKYASQGELSFLSIALSFALASQALSKYNIMLLDEIDGPLDSRNREKFIRILENQIERIGSEQNFLITHNDMFSSYPIDVIDLNFDDSYENNKINSYELANIIHIVRK